MSDHVEVEHIPSVEGAVTTITAPVADVVEHVDEAAGHDIESIRHLLELHGGKLDANTESIHQILGHLSNIANNLTGAAAAVTEAATHSGADVAEAVLTIPEVPAEAVDTAVHVTTGKRKFGPKRK